MRQWPQLLFAAFDLTPKAVGPQRAQSLSLCGPARE